MPYSPAAAEVGPQRHRAERADVVVRGVDGVAGDVRVPRVVLREDRAVADPRAAGERVAARRPAPGTGVAARGSVRTVTRRTRAQRLRRHGAHRVAVARRRLHAAVDEAAAVALEPHLAAGCAAPRSASRRASGPSRSASPPTPTAVRRQLRRPGAAARRRAPRRAARGRGPRRRLACRHYSTRSGRSLEDRSSHAAARSASTSRFHSGLSSRQPSSVRFCFQ